MEREFSREQRIGRESHTEATCSNIDRQFPTAQGITQQRARPTPVDLFPPGWGEINEWTPEQDAAMNLTVERILAREREAPQENPEDEEGDFDEQWEARPAVGLGFMKRPKEIDHAPEIHLVSQSTRLPLEAHPAINPPQPAQEHTIPAPAFARAPTPPLTQAPTITMPKTGRPARAVSVSPSHPVQDRISPTPVPASEDETNSVRLKRRRPIDSAPASEPPIKKQKHYTRAPTTGSGLVWPTAANNYTKDLPPARCIVAGGASGDRMRPCLDVIGGILRVDTEREEYMQLVNV